MNNKEFISALAQLSGYRVEDTRSMVHTAVCNIVDAMGDGETVAVSGLGVFEVKKRLERVIVNPGTGQKMLVPPKLVANFKPVMSLKEKLK